MKYAAVISTDTSYGTNEKYYIEGESAADIIFKYGNEHQNIECLARMAYQMGTDKDRAEAVKIEAIMDDCYRNNFNLRKLKQMDIRLSIGRIRCVGAARGNKECEVLFGQFKDELK